MRPLQVRTISKPCGFDKSVHAISNHLIFPSLADVQRVWKRLFHVATIKFPNRLISAKQKIGLKARSFSTFLGLHQYNKTFEVIFGTQIKNDQTYLTKIKFDFHYALIWKNWSDFKLIWIELQFLYLTTAKTETFNQI